MLASNKMAALVEKQLIRDPLVREACEQPWVIINRKKLLHFAGNDYLDLAQHPLIKDAFIQGVQTYGTGSTGSAQLCGYTNAHQALEETFCRFIGREKSLLFNSGYHANLAALTSFANRHSYIFADKECHASLIDGMQLSRAMLFRYRHQDQAHLASLIKNHANAFSLIVSESVFSMDGSISNIASLAAYSKNNKAMLLVDDAHGLGVIGKDGKGIAHHSAVNNDMIDCLISPFGKAMGCMGAIVSGSKAVIDSLFQFARTHRYSTALPPAICLAAQKAIELTASENWRRECLEARIRFFIKEAEERGLDLISNDLTPIKCIQLGSNAKALAIQARLMQQGIYTACIRPPTVPKNTARIRISLTCAHREEHILRLLDTLVHLLEQEA